MRVDVCDCVCILHACMHTYMHPYACACLFLYATKGRDLLVVMGSEVSVGGQTDRQTVRDVCTEGSDMCGCQ